MEKLQKQKEKYLQSLKADNLTASPFNTLFVGRLALTLNENDLKTEFDRFGQIKNVYAYSTQPTRRYKASNR